MIHPDHHRIITFLKACYAERAAHETHIECHDFSQRWWQIQAAECDVRLKILDEIEEMLGGDPFQEGRHAEVLLHIMLQPYTWHPDFKAEWTTR